MSYKKANIVSTMFLIAVLLSFAVMIFDISGSNPGKSRVDGLKSDFDTASNTLYSAMEGAVLLSLRDYCLMGFANDSAVWVENINLIPDETEKAKAIYYHLNKSISERFYDIIIDLSPEQNYQVNLSDLEIKLKAVEYLDVNSNSHIGYEIGINNVKLESINPVGHKYFNYTFNFPNIWIIYDGMKEYVESPATKVMFSDINDLTKDTTCSDAQCHCGGSIFPGVDQELLDNMILLTDVKNIVKTYAEGLILHMQTYGIECMYTPNVNVDNKISTDIFASGPLQVCPPSSAYSITARSPDILSVWSPEEVSFPGSPLPYYDTVPGVYDYTPALRESFPRVSSNSHTGWPVDLSSYGEPNEGVTGTRSGEDGAEVVLKRLWRGSSALLEVQCKDPTHLVLGADPNKPHEISNLQTRIFLRLNTLATCPMPFISVPFDDFNPEVVSTCPLYCWKLVCSSDGGACVIDNTDAPDPTIFPCSEVIYVPMQCDDCSTRADCSCSMNSCPSCPSGETEVPNPDCETNPECDPPTITESCCDGSCSMSGASCVLTGQCTCETTKGDDLIANVEDCRLIKRCESGQTICACSCFAAGTMITMSDGSKNAIENVQVGEQVLGYDIKTEKQIIGTVLETEEPWREGYYRIYLADGNILNITNEHPLYARSKDFKGWASVEPNVLNSCTSMSSYKLDIGDELMIQDGSWQEITDIRYINKSIKTYNLRTVLGSHTFYVNGVLTHNGNKPTCFPKGTLVSMADGTKRQIEDIDPGDVVYSFNSQTGKPDEAVVLEIESPIKHGYYDLYFEDGSILNITNEHPLWIKAGNYEGWGAIVPEATLAETGRKVASLEVGDFVMTFNSSWLRLENIVFVNKTIQAYNLKKLMGADSYFTNGFVADDLGSVTDEFRSYYVGNGNMLADEKPPANAGPSDESPPPAIDDRIHE